MSKFNIGDKVRGSAEWRESGLNPRTFTGEVVATHPGDGVLYPYKVAMNCPPAVWLFRESELEAKR